MGSDALRLLLYEGRIPAFTVVVDHILILVIVIVREIVNLNCSRWYSQKLVFRK